MLLNSTSSQKLRWLIDAIVPNTLLYLKHILWPTQEQEPDTDSNYETVRYLFSWKALVKKMQDELSFITETRNDSHDFPIKSWLRNDSLRETLMTPPNPSHPYISMHILHTVHHKFHGADKENLFNNQELL